MNQKTLVKKILNQFKPHKDYELEDYYGTSIMRLKRDGQWSIKLLHDYVSGNSKTSSGIKVKTFDDAVEICKILNEYAVDKTDVIKEFNLEDMYSEEEDDEEVDF
jgi:hypothetical protein